MKTIIDLGCGTGAELEKYKNKFSLVGIDIDRENIDICKEKMPQEKWIQGDIANIDLNAHGKVEKIICTEVLEHLQDWKAVVENLVNAPSGCKLFLTVPHEKSEKKLLQKNKNYWQEIGHKHFFSGEELEKELEKTGWEKIKITRTNAALYFELKKLFDKEAPCVRNTYYENILPLPMKIFYQLFRTNLFQTKLKFIPVWIVTLPLAKILDKFWGATIKIIAVKK